MMSDTVANWTLHFGFVLARVSSFVMACPVFIPESTALVARSGVTVVLALSLATTQPRLAMADQPTLSLLSEMFVGVALGLIVRCAAAALQLSGDLVDSQIGFGFSKHFSPLTADEVGPMQQMFYLLVMLGFSMSGGFEAVVRGLAASFRLLPAGNVLYPSAFASEIVDHVGSMLEVGLRIAMPLLLTLSATQIGLALMSRISPAINLWSMGFALTLSAGLVACWLFTPYLIENIRVLWQGQSEGVLGWGN